VILHHLQQTKGGPSASGRGAGRAGRGPALVRRAGGGLDPQPRPRGGARRGGDAGCDAGPRRL